MSWALRFFPEVEDDALAACEWYEGRAKGLGEEFLRLFFACASDLAANPLIFREVGSGNRRRLLRRFPYAIYFRLEGRDIVVVGLFHCARDPLGVSTQLRDRDQRSSR